MWNAESRTPSFARASRFGVGISPPKHPMSEKPRSSARMIKKLGFWVKAGILRVRRCSKTECSQTPRRESGSQTVASCGESEKGQERLRINIGTPFCVFRAPQCLCHLVAGDSNTSGEERPTFGRIFRPPTSSSLSHALTSTALRLAPDSDAILRLPRKAEYRPCQAASLIRNAPCA